MLPPLLSIAELQTPLPAADSLWSSDYEQWRRLPPPQPSSPLCPLLARVGLSDTEPAGLDRPARSLILLSAFVQQAAEGDLLRALRLDSVGDAATPPVLGTAAMLSQKAFDALSRAGCSEPLRQTNAGTTTSDYFSLLARVFAIVSFTPVRLLFPYTKWQTTDAGHSSARSKLSHIVSHDIGSARRCLYHAAQVLQYLCTTRVSTTLDILSVLVCVLYMVLYADIVEQQYPIPASGGDSARPSSGTDIIRLDQVVNLNLLDSWLKVKNHATPHITGVGPLQSGRSASRLYKEALRIMASGASISRIAKGISTVFKLQAQVFPPKFQDNY